MESFEKPRNLYNEAVEKEKKKANAVGTTFGFGSIKETIQTATTKISDAEIMRDDAKRIDDLKAKEAKGTLTSEEKAELHNRETEEIYYQLGQERWNDMAYAVPNERFGIKESYFPRHWIIGVSDGKKITLTETIYPDYTNNQEAFLEESASNRNFYMKDWKGPTKIVYEGWIDGKAISAEEAEKLFKEKIAFAKMRAAEVGGLKAAREIEKYGHPIPKPNWAYLAEET